MIDSGVSSGWSPARLALLGLAAVTAIVLAFAVNSASAEAACNGVCVYTGTGFNGGQVIWGCDPNVGEGLVNFAESNSAIDGCGGESYRFGWYEGGSINWKFCMNSGGERPEPGRFNSFERVASC
jgi:hypothetical protein